MTPSMRLVLCFLAFLSLVSAQNTDGSDGTRYFQPDSLSIGNIVVNCVFGVVFVVLAALSVLVIRRNPGHRAPFLTLFAASLFNAIYNFIEIAYFIVLNTFPENFGEVHVLEATENFFNYWSYALLYVSLALVLYDRHKSNMRGGLGKYGRMAFNALFALLAAPMVSATVSAAFYAVAELLDKKLHAGKRHLTDAERESLDAAYSRSWTAYYTFMSIWGVAALCVAFTCVEVYRRMRRASVQDRITRTMLRVLTPLSVFSAAAGMALTFYEPVLPADLLLDVLYALMTIALLRMGLRPGYWNALVPVLDDNVTSDSDVMVQTDAYAHAHAYIHRNGDYDELTDPLGGELALDCLVVYPGGASNIDPLWFVLCRLDA
ncbi:hypothetical protein M0805_002970 [Coniferiporia weirii]|nr:hypothetical protein M0805_002970 [Coniferiporia weirii]